MFNLEIALPFIFLLVTLVLELIGFLSGHMIDNRFLSSVHEGIFQRCTVLRHLSDRFACYWWSSDTFLQDPTPLQVCVILGFITLHLIGFLFVLGSFSYFYKKLRSRRFHILIALFLLLNAAILATIILVFTYAYAVDTRFIPGRHTSLVFSWSYYTLIGALGASLATSVLFVYNPLKPNPKFRS